MSLRLSQRFNSLLLTKVKGMGGMKSSLLLGSCTYFWGFDSFPHLLQVDHAAAIKEYSRSSADQEEPLPHELRPSEVLSMTMDYLVTNIMDQGEGSYREWYDFVWNRTRGIRKVSTVDGDVR